jgi:hypothetical protein
MEVRSSAPRTGPGCPRWNVGWHLSELRLALLVRFLGKAWAARPCTQGPREVCQRAARVGVADWACAQSPRRASAPYLSPAVSRLRAGCSLPERGEVLPARFVTARYGLARLVAARHAIWRLRRQQQQPQPDPTPSADMGL